MVLLTVVGALLAALLAFLVEPLVGKLLLPTYGGAAGVWTTALVFFQVALLTGYALAHVAIRWLGLRRAALVEIAVVGLALLALPVALPSDAAPPSGTAPALWLLGVLAVTVGAPFVALATATPTLQRWLAASGGERARAGAVRLFAASNAGSLLALLAYPTIIEPNFDLDEQARLWAIGYLAFVALVAGAALVVLRRAPSEARLAAAAGPPPSRSTVFGWVGYAAVPAALVIGTTAQLTTDVAAVPLLWVMPLAVYLATFVLAFAGAWPIGLRVANALLPALALGVAIGLIGGAALPVWALFGMSLGALGCAGIVCHGRLAIARPTAERLTGYDLAIASGGALGGLLAGIVAPLVLPVPIEGELALVAALALRWGTTPGASATEAEAATPESGPPSRRRAWLARLRQIPFLLGYGLGALALVAGLAWLGADVHPGVLLGALLLGLLLGLARWPVAFAAAVAAVFGLALVGVPPSIEERRTFYGERRVVEDAGGRHALLAGTTIQGVQHFRQVELRREPVGYYHRGGPLADVVEVVQARAPAARISVVGLGAGALAALGRPADSLTFYEIDPAIVAIARDPRLFTYLADSAAATDVVVADGRLGIASRTSTEADLVVVDAFNSDAIPVHLLTREAIELYLDRVRPGGIVAFNVSNRYVDLEPVLAAAARDLGLIGLARVDEPAQDEADADSSHVVVLARSPDDLTGLAARPGWRPLVEPAERAWTDRSSDLLGALRWP